MSGTAGGGLALDHLTVADTTPSQLIETAAAVGARAVCMFLQPMQVLPRLPHFDLYGDTAERRLTRQRMDDLGISLDLVYPFTLAGRTEVPSFAPALETAAWLGARAVNALIYDRDPGRRFDRFAEFCDLTRSYGLQVAVEFYPSSQAPSLGDALALTRALERPGEVGVNVDLLHLVRSGGALADVAAAPAGSILYAQYCDGPADCPPDGREFEAGQERRLAGEGVFDLAGFARSLPPGVPASVELPQESAIARGAPRLQRAQRAMEGVAAALSQVQPG